MKSPFGSRIAPAIYLAVAVLLAVLAVVQYRWSTRIAAADAQREREHLDTAASLFANEFNDTIVKAMEFLQSDAQQAVKSGARLSGVPRIFSELYYVDATANGARKIQKLNADGAFVSSAQPEWLPGEACAASVLDAPPALASPVFKLSQVLTDGAHGLRVMRSFAGDQCLLGLLDERYLREEYFPRLLKQSFGDTTWSEYDFAVLARDQKRDPLFGHAMTADVKKPFFSMANIRLSRAPKPPQLEKKERENVLFVQRFESTVVARGAAPRRSLFGDGMWELDIRHKGVPLAEAFERTRRRDLLLSIAVETLLGAAIVFLVIGVRRIQRLAEQKMEFVAAVSHELRAPVSAISMLSRNQADGLITGAEKVQQYGELMHQQSRRLSEMVEQTLQYAGIHSNLGRPAKTEIDLKRLIQEVVEARREELERRGFAVEVDTNAQLPAVQGDRNLLRIAVDNLISNAGKYAEGGRWIRVSAEYSAADKEILVSVEDRGQGIDPQDQAEIFEPFTRGQAAIEAQIPGSGIGLSLVRSAAEAHSGTVTLVSEPGAGSKFTLHLPV